MFWGRFFPDTVYVALQDNVIVYALVIYSAFLHSLVTRSHSVSEGNRVYREYARKGPSIVYLV